MTCIVGLVTDGGVIIGGDSAGLLGWRMIILKSPKVFLIDGVAFGFTGYPRMAQLIQYSLDLPPVRDDLPKYLATDFADAVRKCLKDGGYSKIENNVEEGGTFLVGIGGRLFRVESNFQVGESSLGYEAIGCGEDFALGSMFATMGAPDPTGGRVSCALHAAACFSAGVQGPFSFVLSTR